jgi:hypothetical protein
MATLVAYLKQEFVVLRIKNRFYGDEVVEVTAEEILANFYAAETQGEDTDSSSTAVTTQSLTSARSVRSSAKMYRDVKMDLRPKGSDFVFEVQLTLTGIFILKKTEQKIYTLLRMASVAELPGTFVFSTPRDDGTKEGVRKEDPRALLDANDAVIAVSPASPKLRDAYAYESEAEMELGDVAVEIDAVLGHKEPEIIQSEAPMGFGVKQGMFSCACEPCEPASGDPLQAVAKPSSQVGLDLAATTAKLDAATARIASMEEELALLRSLNKERLGGVRAGQLDE